MIPASEDWIDSVMRWGLGCSDSIRVRRSEQESKYDRHPHGRTSGCNDKKRGSAVVRDPSTASEIAPLNCRTSTVEDSLAVVH